MSCQMLPNQKVRAPKIAATDAKWPWTISACLAVLVAGIYMLSARMSLTLLTPEGVAVFWPAAGIAAGTLIVIGPSARWAVAAGTMVATIAANLLGDRNLPLSVVFALCNAGEALLTADLIERYFGSPFALNRLRYVLGLIGAAIIAAALSGIGGTLGLAVFRGAPASFLITWREWFASDALGIVTIAPLVIGLASAIREPPARREAIEGLVALASLVVMCIVAIALPPGPWTTVVPIALLFPVLLWIAARCRPVFAAIAAFVVTLAIVWTTTIGIGHYGDPGLPMADRVLAARAGILAVALCAYVLAALFAERRQHEIALSESEARMQEALTAGAVTTFVWDPSTGSSQRSTNAAQILGLEPQQTSNSSRFLSRVHPNDRERFKALVRGVAPAHPAYTATFRFKHPDGREIWLEETAKGEFDDWGRLVRVKGLTLDATARKRSEDAQGVLIAALDHRVEDLLARITTVARDARQGAYSLDEYVNAIDQRIQSMADAHALLSQNRWDGVDLAELVRRQLMPYATDASAMIGGPKVTLTVAVTQTLGMVLHELATNAAKHGALSSPHGRVEVSWDCEYGEGATNLSMVWREFGGPTVAALPEARYGAGIIRDLVPRELAGSIDLAFLAGGVCCKIEIPLEAPRDGQAGKLHSGSSGFAC